MIRRILFISSVIISASSGEFAEKTKSLRTSELKEFSELADERKALIARALEVRHQHDDLRYKFGAAHPDKKGFDCSGAIYYILQSLDYKTPRSSSNQYLWLKKNGLLTLISKKANSLDDPVFKKLQPGDLVFWSGTYTPTDGRNTKVTHVGLYLGREKKDNHPVMISSSKGRSYRRIKQDGYGVFDFKLPGRGSKAKIIAYGAPLKPKKLEAPE